MAKNIGLIIQNGKSFENGERKKRIIFHIFNIKKIVKTKIQIKSILGNILFEYENENATIKDAVIAAVKESINLGEAYLRGADLGGAYLSRADLSRADLSEAYLGGVYLRGADLRGADLRRAKDIPYIPFACPSDGAFIGWKKVDNHLIKLEIPKDAKRSSATTNKCRCDKVKVLAITDLDGKNPIKEIENTSQQHHVIYRVGEMVYPDSFDEDRWNECSHGIHFFINKQEAIDY